MRVGERKEVSEMGCMRGREGGDVTDGHCDVT